jgi:light-independent protochlorophyllide reductase subunit B
MGFEGANVIFDSWVHPLMMGLEEHLIGMFREDSEFHADAAPSHLGRHGGTVAAASVQAEPAIESAAAASLPLPQNTNTPLTTKDPVVVSLWDAAAEKELKKIPFFVRGKARRNTEKYAAEQGVAIITLDTLYDAKAHYAR